jgi:hypothetical protein
LRLLLEIAKLSNLDIGEGITSYLIKKAIILHHDECTNMDTDDLGPCELQVLQHLLDHFFPEFTVMSVFISSRLCENIENDG